MSDYDVRPIPLYSENDTWARTMADGTVRIGITDYAQQMLNDIVFVELPEAGATVEQGVSFASAESSKTVSDVIAPLSGEIVAVNGDVADDPGIVNQDPFDAGWLIAIKPSNFAGEKANLLDAEAYKGLLAIK